MLDRIFDEFGLIVCGWSGEWDVALRSAVERVSSHRFGTYWTTRGEPNPVAQKLISLRRAATIQISGADSFFKDLSDKVQAIEEFALSDPVAPRVAVARLKRYLSDASQQINLHDLLVSETERVFKAVRSDRYSPNFNVSYQDLRDRLAWYESDLSVLLPLMICGGYWADPNQAPYFLQCIKRLADRATSGVGRAATVELQAYPALVLFYGAGTACLTRGNYSFLSGMFHLKVRDWNGDEVPIVKALNTLRVMHLDDQRKLPGYENCCAPLSDHLFSVMRGFLREFIPDDLAYDEAFDWFEYLLGLIHCDQTTSDQDLSALKAKGEWEIRAPWGRFVWKGLHADVATVRQKADLRKGQPVPPHIGALLGHGFFGSEERYVDLKRGFDSQVAMILAGHL